MMLLFSKPLVLGCVITLCVSFSSWGEAPDGSQLTHAEAAVILAKYSGFFDRYVAEEASLNECVAFLNQKGVFFGLMEVVNGSEFTASDCARSMGQIKRLLNGEAELISGKVKLPKGVVSWVDYCIMNNINYIEVRQTMLEMVAMANVLGE